MYKMVTRDNNNNYYFYKQKNKKFDTVSGLVWA